LPFCWSFYRYLFGGALNVFHGRPALLAITGVSPLFTVCYQLALGTSSTPEIICLSFRAFLQGNGGLALGNA